MFYLKDSDEMILENLVPINSHEDLRLGDYVICTDISTDSKEVLGLIGYIREFGVLSSRPLVIYILNGEQRFTNCWYTDIKALKKLGKNVCDYEHEEDIFEDINAELLREKVLERLSKG